MERVYNIYINGELEYQYISLDEQDATKETVIEWLNHDPQSGAPLPRAKQVDGDDLDVEFVDTDKIDTIATKLCDRVGEALFGLTDTGRAYYEADLNWFTEQIANELDEYKSLTERERKLVLNWAVSNYRDIHKPSVVGSVVYEVRYV